MDTLITHNARTAHRGMVWSDGAILGPMSGGGSAWRDAERPHLVYRGRWLTVMVWQARRPGSLTSLVARLLVAQAGASAAIGLSYSRRNVPWLVLTLIVAVALCGLAGLARSGSHSTWLIAVSIESGLAAVGLFWFAYARYMGGTLFALITLATLLHPAVARAFAAAPRRNGQAREHPAVAESAPEGVGDPAVG